MLAELVEQAWWIAPLLAGVLGYLIGRIDLSLTRRRALREIRERIAQLEREVAARS